jgi:hypothetical protein
MVGYQLLLAASYIAPVLQEEVLLVGEQGEVVLLLHHLLLLFPLRQPAPRSSARLQSAQTPRLGPPCCLYCCVYLRSCEALHRTRTPCRVNCCVWGSSTQVNRFDPCICKV